MLNIVQNANRHTLDAIVASFKDAHNQSARGRHRMDVCRSGGICGDVFRFTFVSFYESFVRIDLLHWGRSTAKARAWISYVESRLPQVGDVPYHDIASSTCHI